MATEEKVTAIWRAMLDDKNMFDPGRRNDDAVNLCCVAACMNVDPENLFDELFRFRPPANRAIGRKHMHRVIPYVDSWWDCAGENIIEEYGILSAPYMQAEE